tara:strand:+ start:3183 stop:4289 length:1107 start_codon:yes stop_codon:yes gene_type:complete
MFKLNKTKLFYKHEKRKYSKFGYFDTNFEFFNSLKKLDKRLIIISGPARNGNHLMISLFDGTKELPKIPGEDDTIRILFTQFKTLGKHKFLKKLQKPFKTILNSSVQPTEGKKSFGNKWKLLNEIKKTDKLFSKTPGKKKPNTGHIIDYPNFKPKLNYKKFENQLKKNLENKDINFQNIFNSYLDASSYLLNPKKKYKNYLFASSGIRRELDYLCSKLDDIKIVVPIRNFESFYFSYSKSRFNSLEVNKIFFKDLWEHWYHKVNDYYVLNKKYPGKFIFVKYEKIIKNPKYLKKVYKKLNLTFTKKNMVPTINNQKVYGNTSHVTDKNKFGRIYKSSLENEKMFDHKVFGKNKSNYLKLKKQIEKLCI